MDTAGLGIIASTVEAFVTVAAIVVGGIWTYMLFVRRRQKFPRADVTHHFYQRMVSKDKRLVHVTLEISNVGEVLLSLASAETRIQQVMPLPESVLEALSAGGNAVPEGGTEVDWDLLSEQEKTWDEGEAEIEPGETEKLHHDFILDVTLQTVEVYSYVRNRSKKNREIGWSQTSMLDLIDE